MRTVRYRHSSRCCPQPPSTPFYLRTANAGGAADSSQMSSLMWQPLDSAPRQQAVEPLCTEETAPEQAATPFTQATSNNSMSRDKVSSDSLHKWFAAVCATPAVRLLTGAAVGGERTGVGEGRDGCQLRQSPAGGCSNREWKDCRGCGRHPRPPRHHRHRRH